MLSSFFIFEYGQEVQSELERSVVGMLHCLPGTMLESARGISTMDDFFLEISMSSGTSATSMITGIWKQNRYT